MPSFIIMTNKERLSKLRQRILKTFPKIPPPGFDEITDHRCDECNDVRDVFFGIKWWEADDDFIGDNFGNHPLFTHKSYHYYLPAFLIQSLRRFKTYNDVVRFVIYSLSPSDRIDKTAFMKDRKSFFSEEQRDVIVSYLEIVLGDEEMKVHHSDAKKALQYWKDE